MQDAVSRADNAALGWGLVIWAGLSLTAPALPGARWVGDHAPVWVASLSIAFLVCGLMVILALLALKRFGLKSDMWIPGVFAVAVCVSQALLLGIWFRYTVPWQLGKHVAAWLPVLVVVVLCWRASQSLTAPIARRG